MMLSQPKYSFVFYQRLVFILTFLTYAGFHAARKAFTNAKNELTDNWHLGIETLGLLDTLFMFSYSIGLYLSGYIGTRLNNPKLLLIIGGIGTVIMVSIFGEADNWNYSNNLAALCSIMIINGLFQSTGWPAALTIMSNFYGHNSRGLTLGAWTANGPIGNVIGSLLVSLCVKTGLEVSWYFILPSCFILILLILDQLFLPQTPAAAGFIHNPNNNAATLESMQLIDGYESGSNPASGQTTPNRSRSNSINDITDDYKNNHITPNNAASDKSKLVDSSQIKRASSESLTTPIHVSNTTSDSNPVRSSKRNGTFVRAILIPGLIQYSLAFACIKCVNYSLFFWLPYYLHQGLDISPGNSDLLSNLYDLGQVIGTLAAGHISDKMNSRSIISVLLLILSCGCLGLFLLPTHNEITISFVMFFTGVVLGGPANLINSAVAADLGTRNNNSELISTVSGIIDGTGSIGAAAGQFLVALISDKLGWKAMFIFLIINLVVSVFLLSPIFIKDIKLRYFSKAKTSNRTSISEPNDKINSHNNIQDNSVLINNHHDNINIRQVHDEGLLVS